MPYSRGVVALLATLAFCGPARAMQERTPEQLVEALGAGPSREVVKELVLLGSQVAAPALVECIRSAPPDHAWQALRALGALAAAAERTDRNLGNAAVDLAEVVADGDADVVRRRVAALAIARLGDQSKPALGSLGKTLTSPALEGRVGLAISLALATSGKSAAPGIKKLLKRDEVLTGLWSLSALLVLEKDGASCKGAVQGLILDKESPVGFLLALAAFDALEAIAGAKALAKPREKRLDMERKRRWSAYGGRLNLGAPISSDSEELLTFLTSPMLGMPDPPHVEDISMPDAVPLTMSSSGFGGGPAGHDLGSGLQGLLAHAARDAVLLREDLDLDRHWTWESWREGSEPLENLVRVLAHFFGEREDD